MAHVGDGMVLAQALEMRSRSLALALAAALLGLPSADAARRGGAAVPAATITRNARLGPAARNQAILRLIPTLGQKDGRSNPVDTEFQLGEIALARDIGLGQPGTNGELSGIDEQGRSNYSWSHLSQKARALRDAEIGRADRRSLFEHGFLATQRLPHEAIGSRLLDGGESTTDEVFASLRTHLAQHPIAARFGYPSAARNRQYTQVEFQHKGARWVFHLVEAGPRAESHRSPTIELYKPRPGAIPVRMPDPFFWTDEAVVGPMEIAFGGDSPGARELLSSLPPIRVPAVTPAFVDQLSATRP